MPGRDPRTRHPRHARIALVAVAAVLLAGLAPLARPAPAAAALPTWTGGQNLYRTGVFSTQKTWRWCTAADVQIMRNIVRHEQDHSRENQSRYYGYMRNHNRYDVPAADGVDPGGWAAGLRHLVDSRYHVVASGSFSAGLRSAVTNLRRTQRPVGLLVARGGHAWVLTGFTATADPVVTGRFTVTSVRVTGPLWGLQNRTYGYDMAPNKKLTVAQLRDFFTPWHYAGIRMWWEGHYVSIQPIPGSGTSTAAATAGAIQAAKLVRAADPVPAALPVIGAARHVARRRPRQR